MWEAKMIYRKFKFVKKEQVKDFLEKNGAKKAKPRFRLNVGLMIGQLFYE